MIKLLKTLVYVAACAIILIVISVIAAIGPDVITVLQGGTY